MKRTKINTEKRSGVITCVAIGVAAAVVISLILTIGMARFIQKGKVDINGNAGIFFVRIIATLTGSLIATGLTSKSMLPVIGAVGGGYILALLLIGLIILDGELTGVLRGMLSAFTGGAIACGIKLKPQKNRRKAVRFAK